MTDDTRRRRGWDADDEQIRQAYWNGWTDRDDEETRSLQLTAQRHSRIASHPPADVLAERRGEPQRAALIREFWHLTGLRNPRTFTTDPAARAALIARCRTSWGLPSNTKGVS